MITPPRIDSWGRVAGEGSDASPTPVTLAPGDVSVTLSSDRALVAVYGPNLVLDSSGAMHSTVQSLTPVLGGGEIAMHETASPLRVGVKDGVGYVDASAIAPKGSYRTGASVAVAWTDEGGAPQSSLLRITVTGPATSGAEDVHEALSASLFPAGTIVPRPVASLAAGVGLGALASILGAPIGLALLAGAASAAGAQAFQELRAARPKSATTATTTATSGRRRA
jgi:hypothetical protein